MIAGPPTPPLAGFADESTAIGPHASPPGPPVEEPSFSSRDPSEDDATTASDGSSTLTSPIPDKDHVQKIHATQGHKDTQKVTKKAGLRSEDVHNDVAYAGGEAVSDPPSGDIQYPRELDLEDAGPSPHVLFCVTQGVDNNSPLCAKIGVHNHIPRWPRKLVLRYVICYETFPTRDDAAFATKQLAEAIAMWGGVGVTFKQVSRNAPATFRVVYRDLPDGGQRDVLASAFFPNDGHPESRTLSIYALAFTKACIDHQANLLAHEIGHILGFRHEFSLVYETACWSTQWMNPSPNSVMNYHRDPSMWRVQQQDLDELRAFYDDTMTEYKKKPVRDFVPAAVVYPMDGKAKYNVARC